MSGTMAAAAATFLSYSGRCEIEVDGVTHHVEVILYPKLANESVDWFMQLSGDRLSLSMPPSHLFSELHLVHSIASGWTRADVRAILAIARILQLGQ